jgi:hypothetical protein
VGDASDGEVVGFGGAGAEHDLGVGVVSRFTQEDCQVFISFMLARASSRKCQ